MSESDLVEWTDRITLLDTSGVGAGTAKPRSSASVANDWPFTTENSRGTTQLMLPTYAVIAGMTAGALGNFGFFDVSKLLHGSVQVRIYSPTAPAGKLTVVSEIADIQNEGAGLNAIVAIKTTGSDPQTRPPVVTTVTTLALGSAYGFGGAPGQRATALEIPTHEPDVQKSSPTREDQTVTYRCGDGNNGTVHLSGVPLEYAYNSHSADRARGCDVPH